MKLPIVGGNFMPILEKNTTVLFIKTGAQDDTIGVEDARVNRKLVHEADAVIEYDSVDSSIWTCTKNRNP